MQTDPASNPPLLSVKGLSVSLPAAHGRRLFATREVDLTIHPGQIAGIAGESGSGKTMTALAIMGLLPPLAQVSGGLQFDGRDLLTMASRDRARIRGADVAMIFQDPMTSLHPMLSIGRQLTEHLIHHRRVDRETARRRATDLLDMVRIPNAKLALTRYPHQFSGGMRQRIAIASALSCAPKLLIADEPTTALDVTVQAGILRLLESLRADLGLSIILITHDLGVMSALADSVSVMYAGRIVEQGERHQVLANVRHPYTHGLQRAMPDTQSDRPDLHPIEGTPPSIGRVPPGCAFHPRCDFARAQCRAAVPPLLARDDGRLLACRVDPLQGVSA